MDFKEYQEKTSSTASSYIEVCHQIGIPQHVYLALGIAGESGEVAERIKKILRNNFGEITSDNKLQIKDELGDVLWYIAQLCESLSISMDSVAIGNLSKIKDRKKRNVINSKGDNR